MELAVKLSSPSVGCLSAHVQSETDSLFGSLWTDNFQQVQGYTCSISTMSIAICGERKIVEGKEETVPSAYECGRYGLSRIRPIDGELSLCQLGVDEE